MKPSDDAEPTDGSLETDGGSLETDVFTRTSDIDQLTRGERYRRAFDVFVYAPMSVAWSDWRARTGTFLTLFFVLVGTVGVLFVDTATAMEGPIFQPPFQSLAHPLGTDYMGRDMLSMLVHATPAMLKMVATGAFASVAIGTVIGTVSGYKGGAVDRVLMTLSDVVLTIPGLVLIIILASIYPPENPYLVGLLLGIDNWPGLARTIRSQVLSIREQSFTEASRVMGLSQIHILRKDVISNLMPYISINIGNSSRGIIFESVALYFLGVLPFTTNNWGVIMNRAYQTGNFTDMQQIHWLWEPMLAIILFSLGLILFGQGLDRVFNVRLRAKHAKTIDSDEDEPVQGEM